MKKILLQTTIEYAKADWSVERFSILAELLSGIIDEAGNRLCNENIAVSPLDALARIFILHFEPPLMGVFIGLHIVLPQRPLDDVGLTELPILVRPIYSFQKAFTLFF